LKLSENQEDATFSSLWGTLNRGGGGKGIYTHGLARGGEKSYREGAHKCPRREKKRLPTQKGKGRGRGHVSMGGEEDGMTWAGEDKVCQYTLREGCMAGGKRE